MKTLHFKNSLRAVVVDIACLQRQANGLFAYPKTHLLSVTNAQQFLRNLATAAVRTCSDLPRRRLMAACRAFGRASVISATFAQSSLFVIGRALCACKESRKAVTRNSLEGEELRGLNTQSFLACKES
jgi:hypothetical protein